MAEEPKRLIPRRVTVGTSFKSWGGEPSSGTSEGTDLSIEFDVPDGIQGKELKLALLLEKMELDQLALVAERAKGTITNDFFARRRDLLKANYGKILQIPKLEAGKEDHVEQNQPEEPTSEN